jgi:hypothetical protein
VSHQYHRLDTRHGRDLQTPAQPSRVHPGAARCNRQPQRNESQNVCSVSYGHEGRNCHDQRKCEYLDIPFGNLWINVRCLSPQPIQEWTWWHPHDQAELRAIGMSQDHQQQLLGKLFGIHASWGFQHRCLAGRTRRRHIHVARARHPEPARSCQQDTGRETGKRSTVHGRGYEPPPMPIDCSAPTTSASNRSGSSNGMLWAEFSNQISFLTGARKASK